MSAGATELIISDSGIINDSTVDFYASEYGVAPTGANVESGKITITFDAQENDIDIKVVVR